jgi:hypothetical protein
MVYCHGSDGSARSPSPFWFEVGGRYVASSAPDRPARDVVVAELRYVHAVEH